MGRGAESEHLHARHAALCNRSLGAGRGAGRSGEAILDLVVSGTEERIRKAIVAEMLHNSSPGAAQFSIAQESQDQTALSATERKQMLKISVRLIKQSLKGF